VAPRWSRPVRGRCAMGSSRLMPLQSVWIST
jgi:hypothetical protein